MHRSKRSFVMPAFLLLALVACAEHASDPASELAPGLVIDQGGGLVNGGFADDKHALRFSGEVADGGFDVHIEVNGMTIMAHQDADGLLRYDGYASDSSAATHMTSDDRAALTSLAEALDALGPEVDPATARVRTFASVWSEFPSSLELRGVVNAGFRGTTSLCGYLNSFVTVTHDDSQYEEWEDETTFNAFMSMHEAGPCSDGTWFWSAGRWQCYEPDHSPTVEYAYGNCFGRCGNRCGSNTQFTTDCANHDSCQRFGHTIDSPECEDEFLAALDDSFSAPNCL